MKFRPLGRSGIEVSLVSLGTMTFGTQNDPDQSFAIMDRAFDAGINLYDTAEMYAVPPSPETYGRSEEILGDWVKARGLRDKVVLATKVVGPGDGRMKHIRGGKTRHNKEHITAALDASLKRMKTDYVDLYQLHWPDRATNDFGDLAYHHKSDEQATAIEETLEALDDVVKAGKVRTVGLSNENPWGVMRFISGAEQGLGPRVVSVQNPYSLLNRSFETRLAEIALREDCGLLAYAPVGAGALSGKYIGGAQPEGARFTLYPDNMRYRKPRALEATEHYVTAAKDFNLDPAQMALAFCLQQDFMTSAIIGATKLEQLDNNLKALDIKLGQELLDRLEAIHGIYTYPAP